jgi:Ni,Fe-hydrogenase I large subunit
VTIEGELTVRLECRGPAVRRVDVRSTRPFAAARVLCGRAPDDAIATVPRLFSVCGRAQQAAAAGALAAARGATETAGALARRAQAVRLETIQEYLRRILFDWPRTMGHAPATEPVASALRLVAAASREGWDELARELGELAGRHVYGVAPDAWLAWMGGEPIDAWAEQRRTLPAVLLAELLRSSPALGRSEVRLMPAADRATLEQAVLPAMSAGSAFESAPVWNGVPVETGALARVHAHPAVAALRSRSGNAVPARMSARLVELAVLLGRLGGATDDGAEIDAFALDEGEGMAAVQTARGLLLHRARVVDGRVAAYRIVAPTEWNFHPEGPLAQGLAGMAADDEPALERRATLAVQALDPCVACTIEIAHA